MQVHHILDEIVMGGMVLETNMGEILKHVDAKNLMERKEGAIFSNSSPGKGVHNAALAAKGAMSNIAAKIRT